MEQEFIQNQELRKPRVETNEVFTSWSLISEEPDLIARSHAT